MMNLDRTDFMYGTLLLVDLIVLGLLLQWFVFVNDLTALSPAILVQHTLIQLNWLFPFFAPAVVRDTTQHPFGWTQILREHYTEILEEVQQFQMEQERDVSFGELTPHYDFGTGAGWNVVLLRCYGADSESVLSHFPTTAQLLDQVGSEVDIQYAMISILEPGKSLEPHRGHYRGVLRYLLGLSIPPHSTNDLQLRVWPDSELEELEITTYSNGSDVIFDDVNLHQVYNHINQTRIALFIDFVRPDLPYFMDLLNNLMLYLVKTASPVCRDAVQRQDDLLSL